MWRLLASRGSGHRFHASVDTPKRRGALISCGSQGQQGGLLAKVNERTGRWGLLRGGEGSAGLRTDLGARRSASSADNSAVGRLLGVQREFYPMPGGGTSRGSRRLPPASSAPG